MAGTFGTAGTLAAAAGTDGLPWIGPVLDGETLPCEDRATLHGVDGSALAEVAAAPVLLAQLVLRRLRAAAERDTAGPPDPVVFPRAGALFAEAELAGETPQEYVRRFALATGVPAPAVARGVEGVHRGLAELARVNAVELPTPFAVPGFTVRWVPRRPVLAAVMPSNHPEPNVSWVQALSLGLHVLVRPGGRDPFTPRRLVAALLAAGLPPGRVALLPSGHGVGDHLLTHADRSLLYGGPDAVSRWTEQERVLVRGPGRSKALLDLPADRRTAPDVLDHLLVGVADDGGVRCNNVSAVLTTGGPAAVATVADALARRLAELPALPVTDPAAALPAVPASRGPALAARLAEQSDGLTDHSAPYHGGARLVTAPDGSLVHRPLVVSVDDPCHPLVGTELSFPFVVVAPWERSDGVAALRDSLVLNLLTDDADLVDRAVREPSVRKVVVGTVLPWAELPGVPHDGSLAVFLLEPKGLVTPPRSPYAVPTPPR